MCVCLREGGEGRGGGYVGFCVLFGSFVPISKSKRRFFFIVFFG